MERRKLRLRTIIEDRCYPPRWWRWGQGHSVPKGCWQRRDRGERCPRQCNPEKLQRFLRIVIKRESDWRMSKVHNLGPDVEAAPAAWLRHCATGTYKGNPHLGVCKPCEPGDPFLKADPDIDVFACRKVYGQEQKWRPSMSKGPAQNWSRWRAYGYYGQNAALWVMEWDSQAPPEILCRDVESTEIYMRRLRSSWKKMVRGVTCGDGKVFADPTWANLHTMTSSGKSLCSKRFYKNWVRKGFDQRAAKVKLDPDEVVALEMLGQPVPKGVQQDWADGLRTDLGPI